MADKKTVLIIDDEPDTLTYFSNLLEDNGFATLTAQSAADAIAQVKTVVPDLITLDISMPETSGVRCYRDLRELEAWRNIPVVIITGISEDFRTFISSRKHVPPPDGYLAKPIDEAAFVEMVRKLTGERSPAVPVM